MVSEPRIAADPSTSGDIVTRYAIPLIAIGPLASFIGGQIFGYGAFGFSYRPGLIAGLTGAVVKDPVQDRVPLLPSESALRHDLVEVGGNSLPAGNRARQLGLVENDLFADRGVDLGDAVAHEPGAGDEDTFDGHRGRA